jgi:glyoxylase-like metal-dependent hydrolase (beta-lactamase superfamily II)
VSLSEVDLRDLGIFRIPVPVPFPQAGGPVNVYLLEEAGGGFLLFDAGLDTDVAREAVAAGFKALGRRFSEVSRVVVSHGHVDHYGGARTVQEAHGGELPVFAHPADLPKIDESGPRWKDLAPRYGEEFARLGVPAEVVAAIAGTGESTRRMARRVRGVRPVGEGDVLRLRHVTLEILHMPGHTPGLVCAYDRERRIFLSDDHLLEKVSPNPLIEISPDREAPRFRPLVAYLESAARLRALDVDLVLPGHGPPFAEHRRVIDSLVSFYGKRQARILALLEERPRTIWELTTALFPATRPLDSFLTVSEVVANVEVLEARGAVVRALDDGTYRLHPVP